MGCLHSYRRLNRWITEDWSQSIQYRYDSALQNSHICKLKQWVEGLFLRPRNGQIANMEHAKPGDKSRKNLIKWPITLTSWLWWWTEFSPSWVLHFFCNKIQTVPVKCNRKHLGYANKIPNWLISQSRGCGSFPNYYGLNPFRLKPKLTTLGGIHNVVDFLLTYHPYLNLTSNLKLLG